MQGARQGPFTWKKLAKWIAMGVMQPSLLLERGDVRCWLPLWLAAQAAGGVLVRPSPPAIAPVPNGALTGSGTGARR